jgi:hypothetical protein
MGGEVGATATVTDPVEKPLMADELAEKPITTLFTPEESVSVVGGGGLRRRRSM